MAEIKQVQSVARALDLVEVLAAAGGEVALTEMARRVGLQPPTAHRLIRTLVDREWLVQNPSTSRYRLGYKLLFLAGSAEARTARLRAVARPHLELLRDASDESTNLVVLDGLATVYVDQVPSSRPVRMFTEIGGRVPAYASGAGKAMLAFQPPAHADALLAQAQLRPLTTHTVTDRMHLQRELEETRERGYAFDNEEYEPGVVCVAAPILDSDRSALAALSISGPVTRLGQVDLGMLGKQLAEHASAISAELGYAREPAAG